MNPVPNTRNEPRYITGDFEAMVAGSLGPKVDPAETVRTYVTWPTAIRRSRVRSRWSQIRLSPRAVDRRIWDLTLEEAMLVPICNRTNATSPQQRSLGWS
ncbi:hypothetical protein GCM10023094_31260 [Rhodococcus olei]|uniref:Uncharacterized protein n=1 Tax=Rhodococcus olei TaxID=2161675 RepID=A0ABP8P847_9NOCA